MTTILTDYYQTFRSFSSPYFSNLCGLRGEFFYIPRNKTHKSQNVYTLWNLYFNTLKLNVKYVGIWTVVRSSLLHFRIENVALQIYRQSMRIN